jgi:hypothetical protein
MTDAVGEPQVTLDLRYKELSDMGDLRTEDEQNQLGMITRLLVTYKPKFEKVEQMLAQALEQAEKRK